MTDLQYICELMRRDSDALGWIPAPSLWDRIIRRGRYLLQRDRQGNRRGYLLHGPPIRGKPLRVYQVCIDLDHRRILYATRLVSQLIHRARDAGATEILLRCATDLAANAFWTAVGAEPIATFQGGQRRRRWITLYRLAVPPRPLMVSSLAARTPPTSPTSHRARPAHLVVTAPTRRRGT